MTILMLLIVVGTLSAQLTNPLFRPHEREIFRIQERTLPNGETIKSTKPEVLKVVKGKNGRDATLRLDSLTSDRNYRIIFEYDNLGKMIAYDYWYYNEGELTRGFRIEAVYNAQGRVTQILECEWELINSQWINSYKSEYSYDEQGNKISYMGSNWDSDLSQWIESNRGEYAYDEHGNQTLSAHYYWDSDQRQWIGEDKREYVYDNQGNQTGQVHYDWDSDKNRWTGHCRYEYEYDEQGNQTLIVCSEWDSDENQWIGYTAKYEYEYDEHGNQTIEILYAWDSNLNDWRETQKGERQWEYQYDSNQQVIQAIMVSMNNPEYRVKYEYAYDEQGNLILKSEYNWDNDQNRWIGTDKREYAYNDNGEQTLYSSYCYWNFDRNQWIGEYKHEIVYSNTYTNADVITNEWLEGKLNEHIILEKEYYQWNSTIFDWIESHKEIFHYSEITTFITNHTQSNIKIFPNPVQDRLYIQSEQPIEQVSVYDLSGRLLLQEYNVSYSISLANLTHGIYLVKADERVWKVVKN